MRSYVCGSCGGDIRVGHPVTLLRRQALALARETTSWLTRLFHRSATVGRLLGALEERYYLEPHNYRTLPSACPRCGFRGRDELPWWRPGAQY